MKQLKRTITLFILIIIVGMGASLSLKAAIGVGAWDALAQSVSYLSGIKVGTVGIILNTVCVLGQLVILKKDFKIKHLLQVPVSLLLGIVINFFLYEVLDSITIDNYSVKLALLIAAFVIVAFVVGCIMVLNVVTFALEGFCMALSKKIKVKFAVLRQMIDIFSIVLVVILTFALSLPLTLREGTIIGMLIFSPLMGFFMGKVQPVFQKMGLLDDEEIEKTGVSNEAEEAV